VPRAVVYSCLGVGLFYVFCSYAWVVGTGFNNFTADTLAQANPWQHLARVFWGGGWVLIFFAIINSALANSNAGVNAASRVIYAMGRNGVLPRMFGETHPVHKTPHVAIIAQTALGIVVALLLGWKWGPLNGFATLSYALTSLVIVVYITVCVAAIVYYREQRATQFNVWLHGIIPAVGALAFLPPLYYQFHPLPPYPLRYGNWGAITLFSLSVLVTLFMATQRRERLRAELLFVADTEPAEAPPPATAAAPAPAS
jgi:amino acid transporter